MLNVHGHHLVVKGVRDPMVQYLRPQAFACDADGRQFVVSDAWSKLGNGSEQLGNCLVRWFQLSFLFKIPNG